MKVAEPAEDELVYLHYTQAELDRNFDQRGWIESGMMQAPYSRTLGDLVFEQAARYGDRSIPMDEALVHCALDLGGRPYYRGPLPSTLYDHFMRSLSDNAKATLHFRVLRGTDRHHIVEAAFKALGLAVREAFVDSGAVFSTKGSVALKVEEK